MSLFQQHIDYAKDNPKGYWFKRKVWGWGWVPVKWQGWVTMLFFLALITANILRLEALQQQGQAIVFEAFWQTAALGAVLIALCYWKGESPKWQWGFPKKK